MRRQELFDTGTAKAYTEDRKFYVYCKSITQEVHSAEFASGYCRILTTSIMIGATAIGSEPKTDLEAQYDAYYQTFRKLRNRLI